MTLRLTVETGPNAGASLALDRNTPTTVGSGPDCALRLDGPGVAAQHCVIKALRDQGFGVKALAGGVRLNGAEIEAAALKDGDVLEVGATRIRYGEAKAALGPNIAGFRILRELGRGGMGAVYLAEQESLNRQVALKVLDKRLTQDPQFVVRFVAEARAAAKLAHPNVVHVFDVNEHEGVHCYAMELMHEGSLEAWLKKNGRMPTERAMQVVADAAAGLAYAESLGIVHRDIKPDNLMLDQHGTVKIADLGLAFADQEPGEQVTGTPHFMAPEQVLRKPIDHRTDLYALGCTFYRLVTGRTPFRGQTVKDILRAQVKDEAEPAHKVESDVPAEVSAIIQKLMQKEPADRFQSANELLAQLQELLQPKAKKGLWIALGVAGVLLASGSIYWAVTKPKEVIEVEKRYDDPEKQLFADQIKELRAEKRQADAQIALLQTRLSGQQGEALAAALDEVAAAHEGAKAAAEALSLAAGIRSQLAAEQALRERAAQAASQQAAALQQALDEAAGAQAFAGALAMVDGAKPTGQADPEAFEQARLQARARLQAAAAAELAKVQQAAETARQQGDVRELRAGALRMEQIADPAEGWPTELIADRDGLLASAAAAKAAADAIDGQRQLERWRQYGRLLHDTKGFAGALGRGDLEAAAQALADETFAEGDPEILRALADRRLSLQRGAAFAARLQQAAAGGELHLPGDGEAMHTVTRWEPAAGSLAFTDPAKKPARETSLPFAALSLDQLEALAAQVQETDADRGGRACFLAFVALPRHVAAARQYLQGLSAQDDDSGTGAGGYPLSAAAFEALVERLPADAEWARGARSEAQACRLLAAGLRALSDRRNRAAANYLDRALGEHSHSFCVTGLP